MSTYRKSYDGDYTKSYQKSLDWQSQNKKDIEEYLKISKKIASQQYNKNPFSNNYIISNNPLGSNATEKVLANGASSTSQRKSKTEKKTPAPSAPNTNNNQQNKTEQTTQKPVTKTKKKPQVNNQTTVTNNRVQQSANNTRVNTSSNNATSYQNNTNNNNNKTIIILGNGIFLNGKTKKQISENEARQILRSNGFKSISTFKINWPIVIFALIFIVNVFTSMAILLSAVLFIKLVTVKNVTWTKGRESYSLKASNEEMNMYKRYALISLIITIISAIKLYF